MAVFGKLGLPFRADATRPRVPGYWDMEDRVPYVQVLGRTVQDIFGASHAFYEAEAPCLDVAPAERLIALQEELARMLASLPEGVVQLQWIYATSGDFSREIARHGLVESSWPIANILRAERVNALNDKIRKRLVFRTLTYLVVSILPDAGGPRQKSARGDLTLPTRPLKPALVEAALPVLQTVEGLLRDSASKAGFSLRTLEPAAIASFFYHLWNPDLANDEGIPCAYDYDATPLADAWLVQDWLLERDAWRIGRCWHSFVSLNGKPLESSPRLIERLTTQSGLHRIRVTLSLRRLDPAEEVHAIRSQRDRSLHRMREHMLILDRILDPKSRPDTRLAEYNVEAKEEVDEANRLLAEMRSGREYHCLAQLVVHTWANTREELEQQRGVILSRMADMNRARGVVETVGTYHVFQSSLPGSLHPLPRWLKMKSRMAADLVPLNRGFETGEEPVAVFRGAAGGLVTLNLFATERVQTPLAFVAGASGSGKSFLVNQLLLQHLTGDPLVMILDIGGSYERLVRLLGGQTIAFRPDSSFCFNPLQVFLGEDGQLRSEPGAAARGRICRALEAMLVQPSDPGDMLPTGHLETLDMAVEYCFSQAILRGNPLVTLSDILRRLPAYPECGTDLATRLKPYTRGQFYGNWFDGPTTIHPGDRLIGFDLKGISKDRKLCAALLPLLINGIYDRIMANRNRPKILIMDEMWEFIGNERMARFVVEAWKTFRKENTVTIGVSQNLGADIADHTAVGAAILQNTDTWFLLHQGKPDQINRTIELLDLTDGQADILRSLGATMKVCDDGTVDQYRSALLLRGTRGASENSGAMLVSSTPSEYWLATTAPEEIAFFDKALAAHDGQMPAALDYCSRRFPSGILADRLVRKARSTEPIETS